MKELRYKVETYDVRNDPIFLPGGGIVPHQRRSDELEVMVNATSAEEAIAKATDRTGRKRGKVLEVESDSST